LSYWVIGSGKFGSKAVGRLLKRRGQAHVTVVDSDKEALECVTTEVPVKKVCGDGVEFLTERLRGDGRPDWIVPAVPIHLAFQWVLANLSAMDRKRQVAPVPQEIESMVPNPIRGAQGQLYISFADFVCPDYCTEPYDRCTFTGKPRKGILYQLLEGISFDDFASVVVRSRQLAPGVGGYRPEDLEVSLQKVLDYRGPVLYSTACFCHGVMDALQSV